MTGRISQVPFQKKKHDLYRREQACHAVYMIMMSLNYLRVRLSILGCALLYRKNEGKMSHLMIAIIYRDFDAYV